jgi:prophage maintenance system killer protein
MPTEHIEEYNESGVSLRVGIDTDTVWLSQDQLATLFEQTKQNISLHIGNIFYEGELTKESTVKESLTVRTEGNRTVSRKVKYYNLDVIISVGYRVKSQRGTSFRRWATKILNTYLTQRVLVNAGLQGNTHLLHYQQLVKAITTAAKTDRSTALTGDEAEGILFVLEQYAFALDTLDKYDHQQLTIEAKPSEYTWELTYEEGLKQIAVWKKAQNAGALFGNEKDDTFKSSLRSVFQVFNGEELYPSIEEKAANLLYFIVKNHSFSDGNKRIGAGLFIYFMQKNTKLYNRLGEKRIADNALVAITIMIAESKPEEKDFMIKLVVNLINANN